MKKIISYFQHSILSIFIIFAAILSCEELEDEVTNSLTDTVSIFDTISVMDTLIHIDSSSFVLVGEWDAITFDEDTFMDFTTSDDWARVTMTAPTILKPVHEYYFRDYSHHDLDTFRERGVYAVLGDSIYILPIWSNDTSRGHEYHHPDSGYHHPDDEHMEFMRMWFNLSATNDTLTMKDSYEDSTGTLRTGTFIFKKI